MLAGNDTCLDIISRAGLQIEILGRNCIRGGSEDVLARVCVVNEVGTILQGADVYAVVFDIDSHGPARGTMCAVEVDGRQVWAGAGNSGGLLARLHGAASGCEDQQE
jgi:hypothetical protein